MRFSRPSTGTILGGLALFIAIGGTALAATGTVVNIADPSNASRVAHVDPNGKLQVGGGPVSVNGTVTAQLATPSAYLHVMHFAITSSSGCVVVAQPPTGKAMVVRDVRVDVFGDPTPGPDNDLTVYRDSACTAIVADVNPATVGETVLPFDPGLGIASGSGLAVRASGGVEAEVYMDAYSVPSGQVPAAPVAAHRGRPPQQR
jgi:hypothetical protein